MIYECWINDDLRWSEANPSQFGSGSGDLQEVAEDFAKFAWVDGDHMDVWVRAQCAQGDNAWRAFSVDIEVEEIRADGNEIDAGQHAQMRAKRQALEDKWGALRATAAKLRDAKP